MAGDNLRHRRLSLAVRLRARGPVSRGAAVSRGAGLLTTAVVRSKGPDPPLPPSSSRQGRRGRLSRGVCSHIRPEIRPH